MYHQRQHQRNIGSSRFRCFFTTFCFSLKYKRPLLQPTVSKKWWCWEHGINFRLVIVSGDDMRYGLVYRCIINSLYPESSTLTSSITISESYLIHKHNCISFKANGILDKFWEINQKRINSTSQIISNSILKSL